MKNSKRKNNNLIGRTVKLRNQAKKHLDDLLQEQGYRCLDCNRPVKNVKHVSVKNRILLDQVQGFLTYWTRDGLSVTVRIASIDHVKRISAGGKNRGNLEVVCIPCHRAREKARGDGPTRPYFKKGIKQ